MRFAGSGDVSKANGEFERARFGVIQVEDCDVFEAYKRLKKKIKAGFYFGLRRVASFPGLLCLEIESDAGCEPGVDILLGQKLKGLCSGRPHLRTLR